MAKLHSDMLVRSLVFEIGAAMLSSTLVVPQGRFCATPDDSAAAAERRRIAENLRNGNPVSISSDGTVHQPGRTVEGAVEVVNGQGVTSGDVELVVPTGKLA